MTEENKKNEHNEEDHYINLLPVELQEHKKVKKKAKERAPEYTMPEYESNEEADEEKVKLPSRFVAIFASIGALIKKMFTRGPKPPRIVSKKKAKLHEVDAAGLDASNPALAVLPHKTKNDPDAFKEEIQVVRQPKHKALLIRDDGSSVGPQIGPKVGATLTPLHESGAGQKKQFGESLFDESGPSEGVEVNLLSKEFAVAFLPKNQKSILAWSMVLTFLLCALIYASIHLYGVREQRIIISIDRVNEEFATVIAAYADLEQENHNLLEKVGVLNDLFDRHISFDQFFYELEQVTIPEVTYTDIAIDSNGSVRIAGNAPSLTALGRQIFVFEDAAPWIISVAVNSIEPFAETLASTGGTGFKLTLDVQRDIFKKTFTQ